MRHPCRFRTAAAVAGLLALLALAGCSAGDDPAGSAAGAPTTAAGQSPGTNAGGDDQPASTVDGAPTTDSGSGSSTAGPSAKQAEATAAYFLRTEIGMRKPIAMGFKPTGDRTGEVGVYPGEAGEGGQPLAQSVTVVRLRRQTGGWEVTGTSSPSVRVTAPKAGTVVTSPVRLAGSAHAFEGTVGVAVHDNRLGKDRTLGESFVTGGGDVFRPFTGSVSFQRSTTTTGWVVFFVNSAADGQVTEATFVRVRFAP
jgi:hypothetical protein